MLIETVVVMGELEVEVERGRMTLTVSGYI